MFLLFSDRLHLHPLRIYTDFGECAHPSRVYDCLRYLLGLFSKFHPGNDFFGFALAIHSFFIKLCSTSSTGLQGH